MLINQAMCNTEDTDKDILSVSNEYWAQLAQDLEELRKDAKFQRVILEGYFKDKAVRGVSLLATDYVKSKGLRADVMEQLVAISNLEDYFATIENLGSMSKDDESEEQ